MLEDDSQEELTIILTREEVAALYDKARMSRSGWEEMAEEDRNRKEIPEAYRGHTAKRAEFWGRIEEKFTPLVLKLKKLKRKAMLQARAPKPPMKSRN